jgi:hypothetical protein
MCKVSKTFDSYTDLDNPVEFVYDEVVGDSDYESPVLDAIRRSIYRDQKGFRKTRKSNQYAFTVE